MIQQHEVDGVPVLFALSAGPPRAGLVFRAGAADEPLARAGRTHLLGRLASAQVEAGTEHTTFPVRGNLRTSLRGVCEALHEPPPHRWTAERDRLRTLAATRDITARDRLALWRHGAVGHGVTGFAEPGLGAITADDLQSWAARYFTRDNAVLWVTGREMPTGLRLPLPPGERRPVPELTSVLPVTPAWFNGPPGTTAWSTLVPRGPAAVVLAALLDRAMRRHLRSAAGMRRWGAGTAMITAEVAGPPEDTLESMIDVLAGFGAGRVDQGDLALVTSEVIRPDLGEQARNRLAGLPLRQPGEEAAEIAAVTAAEVVAVARTAYAKGLLMVPEGSHARHTGYVTAPLFSGEAVTGTVHPARGRRDARLIAGADGVSVVAGDRPLTVRFDACALYRAWPDGARQLIGTDATVVHVEPELYRDGHRAVTGIDARIPPGVRVEEPPRAPAGTPAAGLLTRLVGYRPTIRRRRP
ncbi:insulinase family protein [Actinoplanes couchii]|uniref:Uncharacterized protein n=1 Tax=Actinoplanes couchii TaxID=403638 RepID=A0ABQ3X296_9ACTN|nr:insulinase family protein [Actinoplanes couchii]MDR6316923.1 hypothetical protein [Actinoplanes couchii]GID52530.1 hypothetical protein Aco03nite_009340 [Actinoplanes couchii]